MARLSPAPLVQADAAEWDSFRLMEAVHVLKAFALVSTDMLDGQVSVSMHPLFMRGRGPPR